MLSKIFATLVLLGSIQAKAFNIPMEIEADAIGACVPTESLTPQSYPTEAEALERLRAEVLATVKNGYFYDCKQNSEVIFLQHLVPSAEQNIVCPATKASAGFDCEMSW